MARRVAGPGRDPIDDSEAVSHVLYLRLTNPRIGLREAARRYFRENPKRLGSTKLDSAAKRVAEKAAAESGMRPRPSDLERLKHLGLALSFALQDVQALLAKWEKPPTRKTGKGKQGGK